MAAPIHRKIQERAAFKQKALALLDLDARTEDQETELTDMEAKITALDADIARLSALQEDERTVAVASRVQVGANHEEEKPCGFGEFLQGVGYMAAMSNRRNFIAPQGLAPHVLKELQAASGASSGVSSDGGFLVRSEWSTALLNKAATSAVLAPKCFQLPVGDGFDSIEAPYVDETSRATGSRWGGVRVYRAAESATVTASKPSTAKFELRIEDLMGLFYATDRVLRDAVLLEALAQKAFSSEFAFKLDDEIVRGTGAGQCLGLLNAGAKVRVNKEGSQTADTVNSQNIINMYVRMLASSMPRAEWFINQEILPQLLQMNVAVGTAGGQLVYMPPGGLSASPYGMLMGRPVNIIEQAAGLGDEGDIIFADLSQYLLIQKPMTSDSSIHVRFVNNETTFRWVWPVIGKPLLASAITPYKATSATTLSPFITLQAR